MHRINRLVIISAFFLFTMIPACFPASPVYEIPKIVSLKQHLPELEKVAKDWHPDAVLTRVSMEIDDPNSDLLAASYGTDVITDTLYLRLGHDGVIKSEVLENSVKLLNLPIYDEDLKLDSTDALEILLDEEGKRYLANSKHRRCSDLVLRRETTIPGYPLLWSLSLWDCATRESNYSYVNATTGEKVIVNK